MKDTDMISYARERTWLRVVATGLIVFVLGVFLLVIAEHLEEWRAAVIREVGALLVVTVLLGVVWEVFTKRPLLQELIDKTELADQMRRAGLVAIGTRRFDIPDYAKFFEESRTLDMVVTFSNTWRGRYESELRKFSAKPGAAVRLFVPDPANATVMAALGARFNLTSEEMSQKVTDMMTSISSTFTVEGSPSILKIYTHNQCPTYTCYKFDNHAVIILYKMSLLRDDVPTFVCERPGGFYDFIQSEIEAIVSGSGGKGPLGKSYSNLSESR